MMMMQLLDAADWVRFMDVRTEILTNAVGPDPELEPEPVHPDPDVNQFRDAEIQRHSTDCNSGSDLSPMGDGPSASSCTLQSCRSKACDIDCCEGDPSRPPYTRVMPEDRRYGVVFSNEENPCCCDFSCVLQFLLKCFHMFEDDVAFLRFSECSSAESFDCNLLMVVDARLCRIFNLFEKQNCGLDTVKWCVVNQTLLEECSEEYQSKVVYPEAENVEVTAYIDGESVDIIKNNCSRICYLVFHLPVDFCPHI
ncbi:uncharacterized protein LOC108033258 [Drosophila biarmipes]|uniref:uncharacterized protein LOC108033258 n=1 Tax=Drosophila biarmipes TaxID=125945 RepID=UPI0007E8A1AE|nr:uncharacterized protein LOC108033258 [Drosophila biarmipes]